MSAVRVDWAKHAERLLIGLSIFGIAFIMASAIWIFTDFLVRHLGIPAILVIGGILAVLTLAYILGVFVQEEVLGR